MVLSFGMVSLQVQISNRGPKLGGLSLRILARDFHGTILDTGKGPPEFACMTNQDAIPGFLGKFGREEVLQYNQNLPEELDIPSS